MARAVTREKAPGRGRAGSPGAPQVLVRKLSLDIAIRPIAFPHLNYRTGTTDSGHLAICGLNFITMCADAHATGPAANIQAEDRL